jgi:C1A family cysteine protease
MPKLGWLPDPLKRPGESPDRDSRELLQAALPPPPSASLREHVVEVLDQGSIGSCVANAGYQAIRISHHRQGAANPPLGSRLFGYYAARAYHHATKEDSGTHIRLFFSAQVKFGFCPEDKWEYTDLQTRFSQMPPTAAFHAAFDQRSPTVYRRIYEEGPERLDAIKRAVSLGNAVVFGTDIANDFFDDKGTSPIAPPLGKPLAGGHAMVVAGYDGDVFDVPNSWGTGWGDNGWCRFSADYMMYRGTRDLWIVEHSPKFS